MQRRRVINTDCTQYSKASDANAYDCVTIVTYAVGVQLHLCVSGYVGYLLPFLSYVFVKRYQFLCMCTMKS